MHVDRCMIRDGRKSDDVMFVSAGEQKSQLLPAGDVASMDDIRMTPSLLERMPLALPTPAPAPLRPIHKRVQVHSLCEHAPQVPLLLAPPTVSQRPPEAQRRPKTIPNILSRSKMPARTQSLNTDAEQGENQRLTTKPGQTGHWTTNQPSRLLTWTGPGHHQDLRPVAAGGSRTQFCYVPKTAEAETEQRTLDKILV